MSTANADQIDAWNTRSGPKWAALQPRLDALFTPVTALLMDLAAPREGERVLDIGCGTGETLLALGHRVGPRGAVLGIDVSRPMLEVATRRVAADGLAHVATLLADASAHAFAPGSFELLFSRFGVMFFDDPAAAFGRIRAGAAPGARLVFACWQPLDANDWFRVPLETIRPFVEAPPTDPDAPGPFAFARPERVDRILQSAGFADIAIVPRAVAFDLGTPDEAADFVTQVGAAARLLADAEADVRAAARTAVAARFREAGDRTVLGGALWLVSARAA